MVELFQKLHPLLEGFSQDDHPTFFEAATIMALLFFAETKCDLVIWETGFGGRLDATNIVTPLASAITNIAFDHQQWLGDTLEKIAFEKAGIIKPGIPVVTATDEAEAFAVIKKIAQEKKAPITLVRECGVSECGVRSCGFWANTKRLMPHSHWPPWRFYRSKFQLPTNKSAPDWPTLIGRGVCN